MIFPVFINRYNDCDERGHGHGCKCPECLEDERYEKMPKEYYEYRYAVPKNSLYINNFLKVLRILGVLIGVLIVSSSVFYIDYTFDHPWLIPITFFGGIMIAIKLFTLISKAIKYDFQFKDGIYIEKKKSFMTPITWEEKLSDLSIPNNYCLTKPTSSWRFK